MLLPTIALRPVMQTRGSAIVATASLAGLGPYYDDPFYAATKHAVVGFVRSATPRFVDGARPALDPSEVAVAVASMLASDETGLIRTIIQGKGARDHEFRSGTMPPPST